MAAGSIQKSDFEGETSVNTRRMSRDPGTDGHAGIAMRTNQEVRSCTYLVVLIRPMNCLEQLIYFNLLSYYRHTV